MTEVKTEIFKPTTEQKVLVYGIAAKMAKDKVDPMLIALAVDLAVKRYSTFQLFLDYAAATDADRATIVTALSYDVQIPYLPPEPTKPSKLSRFMNGLITVLTLRNLWRS